MSAGSKLDGLARYALVELARDLDGQQGRRVQLEPSERRTDCASVARRAPR
jgi:chemotaxis receptor (MCP) glutamine deamidase CheD